MKAPIIIYENIMLRDINLNDVDDLYEYGKDLNVVSHLSWGPYTDRSEARFSIKHYFLKRPLIGLPVGYAIVDLKTNKMIGTVDFHTKNSDGSYEIGYALHQDYWNQGIMTKAVSKLIEVGFYYFGFTKITCRHVTPNDRSRRVIEKNGFKLISKDPEGYYNRFTGLKEEVCNYLIRKEDYLK